MGSELKKENINYLIGLGLDSMFTYYIEIGFFIRILG